MLRLKLDGPLADQMVINRVRLQLGKCPLSWNSKRLPESSISSLLFISQGNGKNQHSPTVLYCYNHASTAIAQSAKIYVRTKHMDLRYHFTREVDVPGTAAHNRKTCNTYSLKHVLNIVRASQKKHVAGMERLKQSM